MNIEPVEVAPVSDSHAFAKAIMQTIARGHPRIPTPTRATGFPKPVIPKYAKLKSLRAFEQGASCWDFEEREGACATALLHATGHYGGTLFQQIFSLTEQYFVQQ
jgi:hypothetical protein